MRSNIKSQSDKRKKVQKGIDEAKRRVVSERPPVCEGCGAGSGVRLECSHRIPIRVRLDLAADVNCIDLYCQVRCHRAVEAGRYYLLDNEMDVIEYISSNDPAYFETMYNKGMVSAIFEDDSGVGFVSRHEDKIIERINHLRERFPCYGWPKDVVDMENKGLIRKLDCSYPTWERIV